MAFALETFLSIWAQAMNVLPLNVYCLCICQYTSDLLWFGYRYKGLGINCIKSLLTDYTTLQNVQMVYSNIWYFARSGPLRNNEVPVYTGIVDESH